MFKNGMNTSQNKTYELQNLYEKCLAAANHQGDGSQS
jgi:hypothetical protein